MSKRTAIVNRLLAVIVGVAFLLVGVFIVSLAFDFPLEHEMSDWLYATFHPDTWIYAPATRTFHWILGVALALFLIIGLALIIITANPRRLRRTKLPAISADCTASVDVRALGQAICVQCEELPVIRTARVRYHMSLDRATLDFRFLCEPTISSCEPLVAILTEIECDIRNALPDVDIDTRFMLYAAKP